MNFWPIEEPPLAEGEVVVTHRQFQAIAQILAHQEAGVISAGEAASLAREVEPKLQYFTMNRLVVRDPRRGCFL